MGTTHSAARKTSLCCEIIVGLRDGTLRVYK